MDTKERLEVQKEIVRLMLSLNEGKWNEGHVTNKKGQTTRDEYRSINRFAFPSSDGKYTVSVNADAFLFIPEKKATKGKGVTLKEVL